MRLELQFKNDPLIELKRADESPVATLHRGYSYNEVKAYAFLRFTRMVNISGAGIGVSGIDCGYSKSFLRDTYCILHMEYCFGCDGNFGAVDGIATSRR